ncbi:MAG: HEAT repeat domain-containing protein [Planctomycetota bacterium]
MVERPDLDERARGAKHALRRGLVVLLAVPAAACGPRERSVTYAESRAAVFAAASLEEAERLGELAASPESLAALRERAIQILLDAADSPVAEGRAHAVEALVPVPKRLNRLAGRLLADENLGVRSITAFAVGKARLAGHEPTLRAMLTDPSPHARASAIYALNRVGSPANPTPLAGLLLLQNDLRLRSHAAFLLGELGEGSARSLLREARATPPERAAADQLRLYYIQIAEALVKLGDERAIEGIRAALYPGRPEELEATALAVQVIGELGDRGSLDALIYLSAAQDQSGNLQPAEVRLAAASAACRLGETSGTFIADEYYRSSNPALRSQAADVYGWTFELEHLPRLEGMLDDRSVRVQISAAESVLRIVDDNAPIFAGSAAASERNP